ncbi:MAG: SAM-dependent methyltransferase [Bryobacteraceae bacterium]
MLNSVKGVTYRVADLERAKQWYRQVLGQEPRLDSPMAVVFAAGDCLLTLLPSGDEGGVAYWEVDDIEVAWRRLLEAGATPRGEIVRSLAGARIARVADPFGNVLGLRDSGAAKHRTLEDRPSESAANVALCRALATYEEREEIRGPDNLAELFLAADVRQSIAAPAPRAYVLKLLARYGSYEYFIARTAWLDSEVHGAIELNLPQIVFLGAGYDSRAYRFRGLIRDTRLFEMDSAVTQRRKRSCLEQAGIPVPGQLTFAPIDFTRQSLAEVLGAAGFVEGKKTLFVWEGVTYYQPAEAIDRTLDFVRRHSAAGSVVCFDYLADAPDMLERYGVKESLEAMRTVYRSEPVQFRIQEGAVERFLSERGFRLTEHLTTEEMERRFLTLRDGSLAGRMTACFRLARAEAAE